MIQPAQRGSPEVGLPAGLAEWALVETAARLCLSPRRAGPPWSSGELLLAGTELVLLWRASVRRLAERIQMLLIFGLRNRVTDLGSRSLACCNGHVAPHRIVKVTRWFMLFFVLPIIPFGTRYNSICMQCGLTLDIPKEAAKQSAFAA